MADSRIVFQDWIVELGRDPQTEHLDYNGTYSLDDIINFGFDIIKNQEQENAFDELRNEVSSALESLSEEEREFVIRYHYMGETLSEISEKTNRDVTKLGQFNKLIIKKLKRKLSEFVARRYGIKDINPTKCQICNSKFTDEINKILTNRDKTKTWRPILKLLKEKYMIDVKTVQTIIGHEKYHI